MWPNPQKTADLVTFTEEILNGKFLFFVLCQKEISSNVIKKGTLKESSGTEYMTA